MTSLSLHVLLLHILFYLTNSANLKHVLKHKFHYHGWGWIPNIPLNGNHGYKDPRLITSDCQVTMKNATYNLGPLHLNPKSQLKYYQVKDDRSEADPNDNYKYAFNVCGPVLQIPEGCDDSKPEINQSHYCEDNNLDANGSCNVPYTHVTGEVYAYQMKIDADDQVTRCWHLSDTVGGPGIWSLLNEDNPSEGVTVSYLDGDYDSGCGHNRQINISFVCDNDHGAFGIPGQARSEIDYLPEIDITNVKEEEICQYKLEFHTVYGCPAQCPLVGNKLCNGVGLCGYDETLLQPRCYCLTYFGGSSCTQIDMSSIFKPNKDPITADLSSPYVQQFTHSLTGPGKKKHEVKVTYDLTEFHTEADKPYIMNDVDGITHTYVWNFMGELDFSIVVDANRSNKTLEQLGCKVGRGYCKDLDGRCSQESDFVAEEGYVYQIDFDNEVCVVAGGRNVSWRLYDEDNPARGVVLTYQDGEYCKGLNPFEVNAEVNKKNRQFEITLLCPDDSNEYLPPSAETERIFDAFVEEDDFDFCNYHVSITSAFACPDECLTDGTNTEDVSDDISICSTHGMCASDPFSGYVHCLCDVGWAGDYCDEVYIAPPLPVKYKNRGSYVAAIIIISVSLVVICYFGYKKINTQKQKVKELEIKLVNYQSSGGGDDRDRPQLNEMAHPKEPSLGDKIKDKFSKHKRGKYSNLASQHDEDEQELFNVKVKMGAGADSNESEEDEENDDDDDQLRYNKQQHVIGDDDEDEDDSQNDSDED